RAFRYGDGLFETMRWMNDDIRFLDLHVARLQEGMRLLQLEQDPTLDAAFIRSRAEALIRKNGMEGQHVRVWLQVYRDGGGLYSPLSNRAASAISVSTPDPDVLRHRKLGLIIDVYSEFRKPYSGLSELKSANSLIYVLAGLYRKKNNLDDVLILNQDG